MPFQGMANMRKKPTQLRYLDANVSSIDKFITSSILNHTWGFGVLGFWGMVRAMVAGSF